jgi:hypothetical protein
VQKSSEFIRTKCGFLRFRFGLVWFAVFLMGWFGFEHPYLLPFPAARERTMLFEAFDFGVVQLYC